MCGIAGFVNKKNDDWQSAINAMCSQMIARGPDGYGSWHDEASGVTLGHRRLSILDLTESGKQPMISASGRFVISFNGEIYNFRELKKLLSDEEGRISYRGTSDTEILLEAFAGKGIEETLSLIRGMFAIALYDRETKRLYLIRDRMGEKPLYYGIHKGEILFASNLDAICAYAGMPEINPRALLQFICYGYIPGTLSIYQNIYKVLPGQYIEIDIPSQKIIQKKMYWDIQRIANGTRSGKTEQELTDEFDMLLQNVIREQMVADVPVGAYLSGGVDSSLIVAEMQKLADDRVRTFTIGIEGADCDEAPWAGKVADILGVKHTTEYISKDNLLQGMLRMGELFSEPFADVSQVPTYMVSRLARKAVTVTLSGDGGDELFCGYSHYAKYPEIWYNITQSKKYNGFSHLLAGAYSFLPRNRLSDRVFDFKKKCEADSLEKLYKIICESPSYGDKIVHGAILEEMKKDDIPLQQYKNIFLNDFDNLMLTDQLQYLPDDILVKVDSTGMGVSLENRVPLLDKSIVEFAWSIPSDLKYDGVTTKKIMRNVLYRYVPRELIERPKQGFSFPALDWLIENNSTNEWVIALFETRLENRILNKRIVMQLWHEYMSKGKGKHIIWNLVMLLAWAETRNIYL